MANNVAVGFTFQTQSGPIPLSELDTNFSQLQVALNNLNSFSNFLTDTSGAANTITVAIPGTLVASVTAGLEIQVQVANTNTLSAVQLNFNGTGNKSVINADGTALVVGQIVAGQFCIFQFDGTSWRLTSQGATTAGFFKQLTVGAPASGVALTVNGSANSNAALFTGVATAGQSFGLVVQAGTTASDYAALIQSHAGATFMELFGDGHGTLGPSTTLGLSWNAAGNVSIANPGSGTTLALSTSIGGNLISLADGTVTGAITFSGTEFNIGTTNANPLCLVSNGGVRVNISSSGNVVLNAPVSGVGLAIGGIGGATSTVTGFGPTAAAQVDMTPDTGTFVGTFTGFTAGVTGTCTWARVGKVVTLTFPSTANGTSNATTFTMTGLPSAIQPSALTQAISLANAAVRDNGAPPTPCPSATVTAASGTVTFALGGASSWTAAGNKGFTSNASISYQLN